MNKDVLVGKRKLNCLSCGNDKMKDLMTVGHDGRMYKSGNQIPSEIDANSTVGTLNNHRFSANSMSRALARSGTHENDERFRKTFNQPLSSSGQGQFTGDQRGTTPNMAHRRSKLPFGFLVQQEKKELHKGFVSNASFDNTKRGRMRPETAKTILGSTGRLARPVCDLTDAN